MIELKLKINVGSLLVLLSSLLSSLLLLMLLLLLLLLQRLFQELKGKTRLKSCNLGCYDAHLC